MYNLCAYLSVRWWSAKLIFPLFSDCLFLTTSVAPLVPRITGNSCNLEKLVHKLDN